MRRCWRVCFKPAGGPYTHDAHGVRIDTDSGADLTLARWLVPVVALVAIAFTFRGGNTLVALLLMGYSMVTQLFPSLLAAVWPGANVHAGAAFAGIVAGEATVAALTISKVTLPQLLPGWPHAVTDMNIGVVALALNLVVMGVVHFALRSATVSVQFEPARE